MWGYVITFISAVVSGVLVFLLQQAIRENRALKKEKEVQNSRHDGAITNGLCCILRKHLMDEHEKWVVKGYITSTALENGLAMYRAYKDLGGNGMIDHMNDDIAELPVRD